MATDPFDDLLELENEYYKEGYDAGVSDSRYAGMLEGKVFGIEKGYEKALELGKLNGRALVWRSRLSGSAPDADAAITTPSKETPSKGPIHQLDLGKIALSLAPLSESTRLRKNIESLLTISDSTKLSKDNSDDSVTDFDDRVSKAKAKAKVIANVAGETLNPAAVANSGIEDATGLAARR